MYFYGLFFNNHKNMIHILTTEIPMLLTVSFCVLWSFLLNQVRPVGCPRHIFDYGNCYLCWYAYYKPIPKHINLYKNSLRVMAECSIRAFTILNQLCTDRWHSQSQLDRRFFSQPLVMYLHIASWMGLRLLSMRKNFISGIRNSNLGPLSSEF